MDEQPEFVTNLRSLIFATGLAIIASAFGAQVSAWHHPVVIRIAYVLGFSLMLWALGDGFLAWRRYSFPRKPTNALEICFEQRNPARRFWSLESFQDSSGKWHPYWEHRVEVRNFSNKTLRNVMVLVERIGPLPQLPFAAPFKRTKSASCDLNPGCSELIPVNYWPQPKQQVGFACGPSAWAYGPIKVTVSADDTPSVTKIFHFNYETEQMLFDVDIEWKEPL